MAKAGRKPITISKDDIKKVEQLAGRGLLDKEIMSVMGWGKDFFYRKKRMMREFSDAIERGRANGHAAIANKLFESAMSGNTSAQQFYLSRRCNWTEKHELETEVTKPVLINFVDAPTGKRPDYD